MSYETAEDWIWSGEGVWPRYRGIIQGWRVPGRDLYLWVKGWVCVHDDIMLARQNLTADPVNKNKPWNPKPKRLIVTGRAFVYSVRFSVPHFPACTCTSYSPFLCVYWKKRKTFLACRLFFTSLFCSSLKHISAYHQPSLSHHCCTRRGRYS